MPWRRASLQFLGFWLTVGGLWLPVPAAAQTSASIKVVQSFPHDREAFTQGLVLFEGKLYESTGLQGRSSLRRTDIKSGMVEKRKDLDPQLFGEGLARVDRRLYQITWMNGIAIEYDLDTFEERRRFTYAGEGWGLCYDGAKLVMSDGTDRLTFRDPETFGELSSIAVRKAGAPVVRINELECVGGKVYANIWQTDRIVEIDVVRGEVQNEFLATGLLTAQERVGTDVLNGIAFIPESGNFYLTGKLWPKVFEVTLGGAASPNENPPASGTSSAPMQVEPKPRGGCAVASGSGERFGWLFTASLGLALLGATSRAKARRLVIC